MDGEDVNNEDVTLSGTPGHSTISDTITVEELDRRQYENDLELVRIELESKKLQLESQKEKVYIKSRDPLTARNLPSRKKCYPYKARFCRTD